MILSLNGVSSRIEKSPAYQTSDLIQRKQPKMFRIMLFLKNFGTWLDLQYGGESSGGWASINAIPTAAHTIWGVLIGKLLMGEKSLKTKLKIIEKLSF